MKKNNLQVTLSAVAWIFLLSSIISIISGFVMFDGYGSDKINAVSFLVAGFSSLSFSLVFFALSGIMARLDMLLEQSVLSSQLQQHKERDNTAFDEWKKQNPTKSINEYYAMKK
jgi:signal transduction histidine kinase